MNMFKRGMILVTFFGCCFAMALVAAALGTKHWLESPALQRDVTKNYTEMRSDASGFIHFGLFYGIKSLNWGIGERKEVVLVTELDSLIDATLWFCTIVFLSLGFLLAVIAAIFAVINTATTPIETIFGIPGLYLWNGLAVLFDLVSVICWTVQFYQNLTTNVLTEVEGEGWTTEGMEYFGYSFWLVVVAMVIHAANCILIYAAMYEPKIKTVYESPEDKPGIIMLY